MLKLPSSHADFQTNPDKMRQYEDIGTIYLTLRVVADWGILEVSKAALMDPSWRVVLPAPFTAKDQALVGDGWTLRLNPGWETVPDRRPGDFVLRRAKQ